MLFWPWPIPFCSYCLGFHISSSLSPSLLAKQGGGMRDMEEIKKTKAREIVLLLRFNEVMARERNR
jgi:hypothetical protein